ncbi:hypothetical protein DIPPA_29356 [Diplonema papillatum]|nr:hypothetical protein DIPPA_29356 [Diplonema papillatum]
MERGCRFAVAIALWYAAANADCEYDFKDAMQDDRDAFKSCFDESELMRDPIATRNVVHPNECFDFCLGRGLDLIVEGTRTSTDAVYIVYNSSSTQCDCILNYEGGTLAVCPTTDIFWHVPLHCAARDTDTCSKLSKCENSYGCCYFSGTVPEPNPLWEASRVVLQWVFLVVALAFVLQVIAYSIFKIRSARSTHNFMGYDGDLGVGMLTASADEYSAFFDALPTAPISFSDSGTACTICLEDLAARASSASSTDEKGHRCIALPECSHRFHLCCIKMLAFHEVSKRKTVLCPNCRVKILPQADTCSANAPDTRSVETANPMAPRQYRSPDPEVVSGS